MNRDSYFAEREVMIMQKFMQFEKLIRFLTGIEPFYPMDSLSAAANCEQELDETELELVSAAGCPDFQSFLNRYKNHDTVS